MARPHTSPQHPTTCEGCDAPIWFKLVAGPGPKPLLIPLRAEPDPEGTVAAAPGRDWQPGRFLAKGGTPDEALGEERWRNHFDDCPKSDAFRKKQRDTWRKAQADLHRGQRTRRASRPGRQAAAIEQPGMFRLPGDPLFGGPEGSP